MALDLSFTQNWKKDLEVCLVSNLGVVQIINLLVLKKMFSVCCCLLCIMSVFYGSVPDSNT